MYCHHFLDSEQIKIQDKLSLLTNHLQRLQKLLMIVSLHAYRDLTHMDHWENKLQQELCQCIYDILNLQLCKWTKSTYWLQACFSTLAWLMIFNKS